MTKEQKETLANVYNTLVTMIPTPSEEYSTKHASCLRAIRLLLAEDAENEKPEKKAVGNFD